MSHLRGGNDATGLRIHAATMQLIYFSLKLIS